MRKLASIRTISGIEPIKDKDRIELVHIDGWQVIVKKGEFKRGDKCVYVEIDSVMPEKPEFEFLRKCNFRIKTIKMGGVISQGICFPLSILPPGDYQLDQDVTQLLGIKQYEATMDKDRSEPDASVPQKKSFLMRFKWYRRYVKKHKKRGASSQFPSQISKTDEIRIQNAPFLLNDNGKYVMTEKVDGSSGSFLLVRHRSKIPFVKPKLEYIVCSRNLRRPVKDDTIYWNVSDRYNIESVLRSLIGNAEWVAIQGECVGPKVQKNKYGVNKNDLYVFNLIYPTGRVGSLEAKRLVEERGMKFVPIVSEGSYLPDTVEEMLALADGKSALADTLREGLVVRSLDGTKSFKAVSNQFLLKWNE